jgi:hypothetical protein
MLQLFTPVAAAPCCEPLDSLVECGRRMLGLDLPRNKVVSRGNVTWIKDPESERTIILLLIEDNVWTVSNHSGLPVRFSIKDYYDKTSLQRKVLIENRGKIITKISGDSALLVDINSWG